MPIGRVLRALVLALAAALPVVLSGKAEAQQAFFATVSDLPLMPGLDETLETALVFDNPEGRIVDVSAHGVAAQAEVLAFYGATLPQLGWSALAPDRFARDGETLAVGFEDGGDELIVRFRITPTGGAP